MNPLLEQVLAAHGGLERWNAFQHLSATVVVGGEIWTRKGTAADTVARRTEVALHREWMTLAPYGNPEWRMTFEPTRVVIQRPDGAVVAERADPRAAFAGHGLTTPWDLLHRAYFQGYALWTYLTTPFLLALPGVEVREVEPWREGEETWRVLRATFPAGIATHSPEQDFYFGADLLLRRQDYQVEVSGGSLAAHYVYDLQTFDGLWFPTRRRAYPRGAQRQPNFALTLVVIDLSDYRLS